MKENKLSYKQFYNQFYDKLKQTYITKTVPNEFIKQLKIKLINYELKHNLTEEQKNKLAKDNKLFEIYKDKYGIGIFDISDKNEELTKFLLKETAIQVMMMYLPLKFSSGFTRLLAEKKIITPISEYEKISPVITKNINLTKINDPKLFQKLEVAFHKGTLRTIDYTIHGIAFSIPYYAFTSLRQAKEFTEITSLYKEQITNHKDLVKNIIMLGGMKYLGELKYIKTSEEKLIKSYELRKNNPNTKNPYLDSKIIGSLYGITLEAGAIYSIGTGINFVFEGKGLTKEDFIFGLTMVLGLRLTAKTEQLVKIVKEDGKLKIKLTKLEQKFESKSQELIKSLIPNEELIKIGKDTKIIWDLMEKINGRYPNLTKEQILTKKPVKDILYNKILSELNLKGKDLNQVDKEKLKMIVNLKLLQIRNNLDLYKRIKQENKTYEEFKDRFRSEDTINNKLRFDEIEARFGETVNLEGGEKIIEDILKGIKGKKLNQQTDVYVLLKIQELIEMKYLEKFKIKPTEEEISYYRDKLWRKYEDMKKEIDKVSKEKDNIDSKIDELAKRLEDLNALEYKEIIEALRKKVENKTEENRNKHKRGG